MHMSFLTGVLGPVASASKVFPCVGLEQFAVRWRCGCSAHGPSRHDLDVVFCDFHRTAFVRTNVPIAPS